MKNDIGARPNGGVAQGKRDAAGLPGRTKFSRLHSNYSLGYVANPVRASDLYHYELLLLLP
jgi:hypothetical protein